MAVGGVDYKSFFEAGIRFIVENRDNPATLNESKEVSRQMEFYLQKGGKVAIDAYCEVVKLKLQSDPDNMLRRLTAVAMESEGIDRNKFREMKNILNQSYKVRPARLHYTPVYELRQRFGRYPTFQELQKEWRYGAQTAGGPSGAGAQAPQAAQAAGAARNVGTKLPAAKYGENQLMAELRQRLGRTPTREEFFDAWYKEGKAAGAARNVGAQAPRAAQAAGVARNVGAKLPAAAREFVKSGGGRVAMFVGAALPYGAIIFLGNMAAGGLNDAKVKVNGQYRRVDSLVIPKPLACTPFPFGLNVFRCLSED